MTNNKKKTIGFFHYQVGSTDGVSLELEKWRQIFEEMGHTTWLFGGDVGLSGGILIPEMFHHSPLAEKLSRATFFKLDEYNDNEQAYRRELFTQAELLEAIFKAHIEEKGINLLVPQNVWSVAANPPVGMALARIMRRMQIPALAHNHDFFWERHDGIGLPCKTAVDVAFRDLPPRHPLAQHAVINSLAQKQLLERRGIEASVVPNIFNFDEPPWPADEYNRDFRQRIGLRDNDLLILQATRIVTRKSIELAIDFVAALNAPHRRKKLKSAGLYNGRPFGDDSRIVFVLAGYAADDDTGYVKRLQKKIDRTGVEALFIEDLVDGHRQTVNGEKIYSLWDAYAHADFVTYPSVWEGWGNQLLEALRAKLPVMLFEYPVYVADIKKTGLDVVSLGAESCGHDDLGLVQVKQQIIEQAADQAINLLTNAQLRQQVVDHNFEVGRKYYSLDALRGYLTPLIQNIG